MSEKDGGPPRRSPRFTGGVWLLALSFLPWLAMLAVLAVPETRAKLSWLSVLLIILSNVMWYGGILLMGPDVYKALKKRWRARRRKKEQTDDFDTRGARSDRVGAFGASGDDQ